MVVDKISTAVALVEEIEELGDKLKLPDNIVTRKPPDLPFSRHVDCLITVDCAPSRVEGAKALLRIKALLDRAMVLLDDIVQILNGPVTAASTNNSGPL